MKPPITPEELAEWRAVMEKATPGPWHGFHDYIFGPDMEMIADSQEEEAYVLRMRGIGAQLPIEANRTFVITARTALPKLLDEVEAGRREIVRLSQKSYPHMCRDKHREIGFADPKDKYAEFCPMCCANNEFKSLRSQLREAQDRYVPLRQQLASVNAELTALRDENRRLKGEL